MSDMINVGACYKCKATIYLPVSLHEAARASPRISFYCAYGHEQHYASGPTEEDKLRLERDRLKQNAAFEADLRRQETERADAAQRRVTAMKGQVTRLKKRAAAGVCPCCNRQFTDLQRHMAAKHAGFVNDDALPAGATVQ